ncbi:hypothetical protein E3J62_09930 [candidate division TA06 bacterium]|uniref:Uncharacterized protein n=1 Tax=candidate division TA06 bacterium TaxID=2250710 RepID=A0A523UPS5_UNCT6|nr:MAG: hypothetical protein E3J62_09930 [candidate division TA06 bacterium]
MKSRIQTVNWRRPAWMGVALLCGFLIGCTGHTHRIPESWPDEAYVRFDTKDMIFEYYIPGGHLDDPDTKVRLVFIGPRGKAVRENEWGQSRRCGPPQHIIYCSSSLDVKRLRQLARKGGLGTWKVVLIVKKPGQAPLEVASEKFTLSRRTLRMR